MKNKYDIRGDVTVIFLNRKDGSVLEALIDTNDLEKVDAFNNTWVAQYSPSTKSFYVKGSYGSRKDRKIILLHRLVTDCPIELVPDHINWNTLDNRKYNLRLVTQGENLKHKRLSDRQGKGIYFDGKKWIAHVFGKTKQYIGRYQNEDDAKNAIMLFKESGNTHKRENRKNGSVSWQKNRKKWQVRITVDGKQKHIGLFAVKKDAEDALNKVLSVV